MTLEDILRLLGSKYLFLKKSKVDEEGCRYPFSKSGAKAYEKLTAILYAIADLTETELEDVIETLDNIANDGY